MNLLLLLGTLALFAQSAVDDVLNTPFEKLQLNMLSIYAVIRILGQAFAAIRAGGGLKGIFNALVYGENAPKVIMRDYQVELGLKPAADTPPPPPAPPSTPSP